MGWFTTEKSAVADELEALYSEYRRLERQLDEHAEKAPYPQVATRLKALLVNEGENAASVSARLAVLGRYAESDGTARLRDGSNSWERLIGNLDDYRALIRTLGQLFVRWDDESPEDALLVRDLRERAQFGRMEISDMISRADPHALN
ncbi:MAG: hypothetical protein P8K76_04835 [Candidatus Binatia bacterium]|nr:hypothetical protein [Candidatus Binatia bacterium]MDG1958608.1 hypothetical protein [Candidatus Binatia bacterium]MDG2009083.1 hypothetical protein [Candidatus Binatia bacterium]HAC78730.1 hypothetical protein [Deltaproteobacteria bacterium]